MPKQEDQSSELSEYERRRLENIQRNSAFVEGLNFIQVLFIAQTLVSCTVNHNNY